MHRTPPSALPAAGTFAPAGVSVLERGWLSSNNVVLHDAGHGAVLVDSGHVLHVPQTMALLRHALQGEPLATIVNTHLHSDHCGGNAALQRATGCHIRIPPGSWDAVQTWDVQALGYAAAGQRCERFEADSTLSVGDVLSVGTRRWLALAAPGHDPHAIVLFDERDGVVITADALWQRGFGVVFPELNGDAGFDDVAATLDLIERLGARWAIPGHGAPFQQIDAALAVARQRLAAFRADPRRHARHAMKALIKYHLLEVGRESWPDLLAWIDRAPLYTAIWARCGHPGGSLVAFATQTVSELASAGVLALRDGVICNE